MIIECPRLEANPFLPDHSNRLPGLVSNGKIKQTAAKEAGLNVLSLPPELLEASDRAEENLHRLIDRCGRQLVGFYKPYPNLPPRPVLAVVAKSRELARLGRTIELETFFTTDCLWVIDLTPTVPRDVETSEVQLSVNKPNPGDKKERETLLQLIYHGAKIGARLITTSGVGVYDQGRNRLTLGLIEVDLGQMRDDIDIGGLEHQIKNNDHYSAGFTTEYAIEHLTAPSIVTTRFTRWVLDDVNFNQLNPLNLVRQSTSGSFRRPTHSEIAHSSDPVNWAVHLFTLGVVPVR